MQSTAFIVALRHGVLFYIAYIFNSATGTTNQQMIVLTTGKGGVGKTTTAAVTAWALAAAGQRTAVVSIDPAHSLGDVLGVELRHEPTKIATHLDAAEVHLSAALAELWGTVRDYLVRLFASQGVDRWLAEEVAFLPGLEEVAGLLALERLRHDYDVVVVDCPPTGSTLRFLNLPEAVRWYMERFFPTERKIVQAVGPLAERLVGVPMPDRIVFDQVEAVFKQLLELRRTLTDPDCTVAQVVTTPERVVVHETERAIGYLSMLGVGIGRVVVNRADAAAAAAVAAQVAPLATLAAPLCSAEPIGIQAIAELADVMFAQAQARPARPELQPVMFAATAERAELHLRLPRRAAREGFRVGRRGDDLIVDWGPVRRHLPLPPAVAVQTLVRATWVEDGIRMEFAA